jgi:hypothetical protein
LIPARRGKGLSSELKGLVMEMDSIDIATLNKNIQDSIFGYKVRELPAQVTGLFETIVALGLHSKLAATELRRFNQLFEGCLQALQNKDYLNLADMLQYEILPMLDRQ